MYLRFARTELESALILAFGGKPIMPVAQDVGQRGVRRRDRIIKRQRLSRRFLGGFQWIRDVVQIIKRQGAGLSEGGPSLGKSRVAINRGSQEFDGSAQHG